MGASKDIIPILLVYRSLELLKKNQWYIHDYVSLIDRWSECVTLISGLSFAQ